MQFNIQVWHLKPEYVCLSKWRNKILQSICQRTVISTIHHDTLWELQVENYHKLVIHTGNYE